jgi:AAA family ATP:ADP antiporter
LFWGLANDTTSLSDAHILYPLFGLGANLAQACAGVSLKMVKGQGFGQSMNMLMLLVLALAAGSLAVHAKINARAERSARLRVEAAKKREEEERARLNALDNKMQENRRRMQLIQDEQKQAAKLLLGSSTPDTEDMQAAPSSSSPPVPDSSTSSKADEKTKPSMGEALSVLANSIPIRCLAVMSLAQGLCSSLMEFAWKSHIRLLFPDPGNFTAFLGDVSTAQVSSTVATPSQEAHG